MQANRSWIVRLYCFPTFLVQVLLAASVLSGKHSLSLHENHGKLKGAGFDKEDTTTIVEAVVNQTAILPCRPFRKSSNTSTWIEPVKGTLLWKRASTNEYLVHDNRRLHPDMRFILDMSSFDQTVMDLRIDGVQREDEGLYICLYSTGQNVYQRKLQLNVLVPPIIYENTSSPLKVSVHEGETTVLQCRAWGIPEPSIVWHMIPQDGTPRQLNRVVDKHFIVALSQLKIVNVTKEMNGMYKCLATNGLEQTASRIIELDVRFPPKIIMSNRRIGQLLHRTTMVQARIRGNPIGSFYWEFEQRPIYGPNSNCLVPVVNEKYCVLVDKPNSLKKEIKTSLFISNLSRHDYGLYTCVVESPFGVFRNSTEVFRTYPLHAFPWENQYVGGSPVTSENKPVLRSSDLINKRETYLSVSPIWKDRSAHKTQDNSKYTPQCRGTSCQHIDRSKINDCNNLHYTILTLLCCLVGLRH